MIVRKKAPGSNAGASSIREQKLPVGREIQNWPCGGGGRGHRHVAACADGVHSAGNERYGRSHDGIRTRTGYSGAEIINVSWNRDEGTGCLVRHRGANWHLKVGGGAAAKW